LLVRGDFLLITHSFTGLPGGSGWGLAVAYFQLPVGIVLTPCFGLLVILSI